jgi:tRNA(Ile)-lysidine synthase
MLLERLNVFLNQIGFDDNKRPALLAVSGGLDSCVLAFAFHTLKKSFAIAHINYGLRGEASTEDANFVEAMAQKFKVPFHIYEVDDPAFLTSSVQTMARKIRYDWFARLCSEKNYAGVFTAHHLDDGFETFIINLMRGTGLNGLKGIDAQTAWTIGNDTMSCRIYRPFIEVERSDVFEFAMKHNIFWREDQSNKESKYNRNKVRHLISPVFKDIKNNYLDSYLLTTRQNRATWDNYQFLLNNFFATRQTHDGVIFDKKVIYHLPNPVDALYDQLRQYGFSKDQCSQICDRVGERNFKIFSSMGYFLQISAEQIHIVLPLSTKNVENVETLIHEHDLLVKDAHGNSLVIMETRERLEYPDGKKTILIDADRVSFPLKLRYWKNGDSFFPFGMNGQRQKLQDFFTNLKLTTIQKNNTPVLIDATGAILWVVGFRMDDRVKITSESTRYLKVSYSNFNPKLNII